jgi:hypothetical protein
MEYLHRQFRLNAGDIVEVTLDGPANVMLLDPSNYEAYRNGRSYRYHGGHTTTSPARLVALQDGMWHLVVDLGGYPGSVRAGVRVFPGAVATR